MKKAVVIATDENPDYLFYIPIINKYWQVLGWDVIYRTKLCLTPLHKFVYDSLLYEVDLKLDNERSPLLFNNLYKTVTIYQSIRLYAANYFSNYDYLMVSDADMLPLISYWNPDYDNITSYGRDLTDYHYPMCYIGMNVGNWRKVMELTGNTMLDMKRDLDVYPKAKSDKFEDYWCTDQDIITERLANFEVTRIDRGVDPNTGYPKGRIDRSAWDKSLLQKERIDAHLFRKGWEEQNFQKILKLIIECFNPSSEEITWLMEYRDNFIKLL